MALVLSILLLAFSIFSIYGNLSGIIRWYHEYWKNGNPRNFSCGPILGGVCGFFGMELFPGKVVRS